MLLNQNLRSPDVALLNVAQGFEPTLTVALCLVPSCHRSKEEHLTTDRKAVGLEVLNHAKSVCLLGPVQGSPWRGECFSIDSFVCFVFVAWLLHWVRCQPIICENCWDMLGYVCCFADVWFKGKNGGRPCLVKAGTMLSESFRVFQSLL